MFVTISVKGVKRNISVKSTAGLVPGGQVRGKARVNGRTVRGLIKVNAAGAKKFVPTGSNASLLS